MQDLLGVAGSSVFGDSPSESGCSQPGGASADWTAFDAVPEAAALSFSEVRERCGGYCLHSTSAYMTC